MKSLRVLSLSLMLACAASHASHAAASAKSRMGNPPRSVFILLSPAGDRSAPPSHCPA